jgi:HAD superfamily hydrolase (TIGR01450 family)
MATGTGALPPGLVASDGPLLDRADVLLVDLDGVAYLGDRPIEGAADALTAARKAGVAVIFVTNNASRPPAAVADQLTGMGVLATSDEVMTSSIAAAQVLAGRLPPGTAVLAVGGEGVGLALADAGLTAVTTAAEQPAAVLQGFGADVGWRALAEASVAVRAGASWIATNDDVTLPSPRGPLPGNGSLIAALAAATGMRPEVIGKPHPALFDAALRAGRGSRPLVVGDRLDTDIAGARSAGLSSLVVLSGVSTAADLVAAGPESRPNYVGSDLRTVTATHPGVEVSDGVATAGGCTASMQDGTVVVRDSNNAATPDGLDGLRALCALAWSASPDRAPDLTGYDAAIADL